MIDVFHADDDLQQQIQQVDNERELIKVVMQKLDHYSLATRVCSYWWSKPVGEC
jgi:hypothetical protein